MKIYTSYYGNMRKLDRAGILPISISLGVPGWFKGSKLSYLAPTRKMLDPEMSEEEYIKLYKGILGRIKVETLREDISNLTRGKDVDIALLCWEKPGDFCHRHLFAEWMKEQTGYEIEEFGGIKKKETVTIEAIQQPLFPDETEIYTSYFGNIRKLQERGIVPIGIARFPPKWLKCEHIYDLAPRADMLNMSPEQYDLEFKDILNRLNPKEIQERIKHISKGKVCALLCFEKPPDPCHRHDVANWLNKTLGLKITEFK